MALPVSRNTNYAPTDPVKSADLDDVQDQIIALADGLRNSRKIILPLAHAVEVGTSGDVTINGLKIATVAPGFTTAANLGIPLEVGDTIEAITFYGSKDSTGNLTVKMYRDVRTDTGLGQTEMASATITATGEGTTSSITDPVIEEDYRYYLSVEMPDENAQVTYIEITVSHA